METAEGIELQFGGQVQLNEKSQDTENNCLAPSGCQATAEMAVA